MRAILARLTCGVGSEGSDHMRFRCGSGFRRPTLTLKVEVNAIAVLFWAQHSHNVISQLHRFLGMRLAISICIGVIIASLAQVILKDLGLEKARPTEYFLVNLRAFS